MAPNPTTADQTGSECCDDQLNSPKAYRHTADQRLDHAHQVTSRLVRENQTIGCETLAISPVD